MLLPQIEELDGLLMRMPALVDAAEREDPSAREEVRDWLAQLEHSFERNRLASPAAAIAALRAELRLVALGASPPALVFSGQPRARRMAEAAVLDVLRRAERAVADALASTRAVHEEAERMMRQLVAIARHKDMAGTAAPGPSDELGLRRVWGAISADPDMASGVVRVAGLVGEADALALLDRALASP